MTKFNQKVALVTGSCSGISRATALKLASEGASVLIGNRNEQAGQETVELIQKADGKASFYKTEVTQLETFQKLVKFTQEASFISGQGINLDGGFTTI